MISPEHPLADVLRRDPRYRLDAYALVYEALEYGQQRLDMGQSPDEPRSGPGNDVRHVTGQQLCEAIRQYTLRQYGPLAKTVLNHWGVRSTSDFGEIVFNLIDIGKMHKTENDRREDFDKVFDFDEGLREAFEPLASESGKERGP
jgi:uncharacterized repeat protein (TIGR04138 family)